MTLSSNFDALQTQELLTLVRGGDHDAWREMYRRYRPLLQSAANEAVGQILEDPDDVLQSAFLAAWKNISQFSYKGQGSFRGWLRTIVVHKNIEKLRKLNRRKRTVPEGDMATGWMENLPDQSKNEVDQHLESKDEMLRLTRFMEEQLKPIEREVLTLRLLEQLTTSQVAEVVELEQDKVRRIYRRSMKSLASSMNSDTE